MQDKEFLNSGGKFFKENGEQLNDAEFIELGSKVVNTYNAVERNNLNLSAEFMKWLNGAVEFIKDKENKVEALQYFKNATVVK